MSVKKRLCLPLQRKETLWFWTCLCPLRGMIPDRASGEATSKLGEGEVAAPGKRIQLQRKATVGEVEGGLLRPGNLSLRGEDAEVLSSAAAAEEVVAEVGIWTETRRGPMLTLLKRKQWARTRLLRRRRP